MPAGFAGNVAAIMGQCLCRWQKRTPYFISAENRGVGISLMNSEKSHVNLDGILKKAVETGIPDVEILYTK